MSHLKNEEIRAWWSGILWFSAFWIYIINVVFIFFFNFFLTFIYFRDREKQSMNGEGAEREGDTESEAGSRLWAISPEPDVGAQTHRPRDCDLSWSRTLNRLSHPGAPTMCLFLIVQSKGCAQEILPVRNSAGVFGVRWLIPMSTSQNWQRKGQVNTQLNWILF